LRPQSQAHVQSDSLGSSAIALSDQDIIRSLRGLLATLGSSSMGTASFVTDSSGTARPPPYPPLGMSPWYLDSGASFHMTSNSSLLSTIALSFLLFVLSWLMVPLFLSLVGALFLLLLSVPNISHVPHLKMNLFSASQLTDSGYRIILDADSCAI
jgi:hypothetical protein